MWDSALPVLLGLDSFVAGLALAPLLRGPSSRVTAVALFGAADAAATLAGGLIALPLGGLLLVAPGAPALFGLYLLAAGFLAARGTERAAARASALPVTIGLAVALAIDNLVAGDGGSVVATGCVSAALMLFGLVFGGRVFDRLPDVRRSVWTGAGLVGTALLAVVA